MKTQKKLWFLVFVTLIILLCGTGCGAKISTSLNIDNHFSGKRVITCVVSKSDAEGNFEGGIASIDTIVNEKCPESMMHEKTEDESSVTYTFSLEFSSFEDYKAKVEALLGRTSEMEFHQPDSVFSSGISLKEDFDSRDLLNWFKAVVEENKLMSDISNLWELGSTKVVYVEEEISTGGKIQFDRVESNPISNIQIETSGADESLVRTVFFDMPAKARDDKKEQVDAYMASLVPTDGTGTWETLENGYRFVITFSADSADTLTANMKVIFGETYLCEETIDDSDPFVTVKTKSESFDVYQFGNTSRNNLRVNYIYNIEEKENRTIGDVDSEGWVDNNQYLYDEYTDTVYVKFFVRDITKAKDAKVNFISDTEKMDAIVDIYFAEGQEEAAKKAATYYGSLWEDVTAEADGVICRISCLSEKCSVLERLAEVLEVSSVVFHTSVEEKLMKNTCNVNVDIYLGNLAYRAGITEGNVDFSLELKKYDFQTVTVNGVVMEEAAGKNTLDIADTEYIYLTGMAEKTNTAGIILVIALIAAAVAVLIVGFIFLVKYLSKRDGLEDEPMADLMKLYLVKGLKFAKVTLVALAIAIYRGVVTLVKYIKHVLENYYPEGSHRKIIDYFFGSRWPVYILLVSWIALPVSWFVISLVIKFIFLNPLWKVYGAYRFILFVSKTIRLIQGICVPVAVIWYFIDKFRTNPEIEAEYDRVFNEDLERFKGERGLQQLGLAPEQVALVEPLKLVGPDYEMKEQQLKGFAALWRWIRRFFIYEGRLAVKQGADGKIRYSCAAQNIWYFSENQLCRYEVNYDLCTGAIRAEATCETFYQDLSSITTKEKVVKIRKYFTLIPQVYQSFIVETNSGNTMSAVVDSGLVRNDEITSKVKAMGNLARERKSVVAQKKNKRGNKV